MSYSSSCFVKRKNSTKSNIGVYLNAQDDKTDDKSEKGRPTENFFQERLGEVKQKALTFSSQSSTMKCYPCTGLEIEAALRYQRRQESKTTEQVKIFENQQHNQLGDEQKDDNKWSVKILTSIEKEASMRSKKHF